MIALVFSVSDWRSLKYIEFVSQFDFECDNEKSTWGNFNRTIGSGRYHCNFLLTIIAPSLKLVKEKTGLVKCANNQYQIVLAVSGYAAEWGGKLPSPVTVRGIPSVLWRTSDVTYGETVSDAHSSLGDFLTSAEIYNCPLSSFAKGESFLGGRSYQDHYTNPYNNDLPELFCSYQLLWNYSSFNPVLTASMANSIPGPFLGASSRSKNKLLVCEAMSYTDTLSSGGMQASSWASPHRFEGSSKVDGSGFPFYFRQGTSINDIDRDTTLRQIRLNAGYIDGRVERYVAGDTYKAQVYGRYATMLLPKSWK